jgi:uncharacterized tellurite resistance protein B-like protein
VTDPTWQAATFAGAAAAQSEAVRLLTPDQRLQLLEQLLEVAVAAGALQRSREQKQRDLDLQWSS